MSEINIQEYYTRFVKKIVQRQDKQTDTLSLAVLKIFNNHENY